MRSHTRGVEGDKNLPCPVDCTSFDGSQEKVGFLACGCMCLVQPLTHQHLLLNGASLDPFSTWIHSLRLCFELPQPRCSMLHLTLQNFMMFSQVPLSSLSKSFWMTFLLSSVSTAPLSLVLSKHAEELSIPVSRHHQRCQTDVKQAVKQ